MLKIKSFSTRLCHIVATLVSPLAVILFIPHLLLADNRSLAPIETLPLITVTAPLTSSPITVEEIDNNDLRNLPATNGNLTEAFKSLPGIQFSEAFESSRTGGEIIPPEISISGGRPEDNSFLFDGIGNNSLLDPAYKFVDKADNIPGHSQEIFILDHLIESVSVYRAAVPARFGGFNGGVVDAKTINPEPVFGGRVSYRMSRSAWGKFHLDDDDRKEFYTSANADNQPEFDKYQFSTTWNFPLNEQSAFLFDYSRLQSSIPLRFFENEKKQHRLNENIFVKYVTEPRSDTKITLSGGYMPYEGEYYLKDTRNSDYSLKGGGYKLSGQLARELNAGNLQVTLGYQSSRNSREAPQDYYSWANSSSTNWGTLVDSARSKEGGFGDLEKEQATTTLNAHYSFQPLEIFSVVHTVNTGISASYAQTSFHRTEESIFNTAWLANGSSSSFFNDQPVSCTTNDPDCIDNEQFIFSKQVRPQDNAAANMVELSGYFEDDLKKDRWSLRPGVHLAYDNYQQNFNLSPRLAATYELRKDRKTILVSSLARYYNRNLLTLLLEEQKKPYENFKRSFILNPENNQPEAFIYEPRSGISSSRVSDLETPYVDEWTLGIQQKLWQGVFEVLYIDREYKDQIISIQLDQEENSIFKYKEWNNAGRRSYQELSLKYSRNWGRHSLSMNITWSDMETNSSNYRSEYEQHQIEEEPDDIDFVWHAGQLKPREDLPPDNYGRPVKASLVYTVLLPHNVTFTNSTNYRGRYKTLTFTGAEENGYQVYDVVAKPSAVTFDWKLRWQLPAWNNNMLELSLDILNVFNKRNHYGPEEGDYLLGRQFWAGLDYSF